MTFVELNTWAIEVWWAALQRVPSWFGAMSANICGAPYVPPFARARPFFLKMRSTTERRTLDDVLVVGETFVAVHWI